MSFENINLMYKTYLFACAFSCLSTLSAYGQQALQLNDSEYFERQGINLLVFNNSFNGGFNDEKNSGIELIQHGVRVAQGGAARPKNVFYGNNRADFSFIPGNIAPGVLFRKPDHFENYDDWPFLWGQNEGTIAGNTQYVIFGSALKNMIK